MIFTPKRRRPKKIAAILALISLITSPLVGGDFFSLLSTYDEGRYTYSFTDGIQPLSFAAIDENSGGIRINVPDAKKISVPDDWRVSIDSEGFTLTYAGPLFAYPIGYAPLEISFDSALTPDDIDPENPFTGPLSGLIYGMLVMKNTSTSSEQKTGDSSYLSNIVGYASFYYGVELPESPIISESRLIELGFNPQDLVPVASNISVNGNLVCIELDNIISEVTYHLEYRPSLSEGNWVFFSDFTISDLDEKNCLFINKQGLKGYFRIVMPE